jgi:hypothetical protein
MDNLPYTLAGVFLGAAVAYLGLRLLGERKLSHIPRFGAALSALVIAFTVAASACTPSDGDPENAREREENATGRAMDRMTQSQQVPEFDYSQERQTLIDVLTVRAEGTHGTSVATALDGTLLWWCPTQGAPVPSTYQLTNPDEVVTPGPRERGTATVPQAEPTGVYSAGSAATWVVCLDDNGTAFGMYEEANVRWTSGVVNGLPGDKRAKVDEITFEFTDNDE